MGNLKSFFSLVKIGFLIFRVIRRTREKDVFIEANKRPREKTTLPFVRIPGLIGLFRGQTTCWGFECKGSLGA
jgi:hypothetical protein